MTRFTKEFGSYYLRGERGNIIYMADELAFLVDREVGIYLKHGPVEGVNAYLKKMHDASPLFTNLQVVSSREWDVDLLNWLLEGSGRIGDWLNGAVEDEPWKKTLPYLGGRE